MRRGIGLATAAAFLLVDSPITANPNRCDGVEPNRRLSAWADSRLDWPQPHAPARFGDLVFVC